MHLQAEQRLDGDVRADIAHQGLAGQHVAPVDAHRVRAAHAVRARTAERQRAVVVALDMLQQVQHAVVLVGFQRVRLVVAASVLLRGCSGRS